MDENNVKPYRVYKITSVNTPLFYVSGCSNPKAYLSQILHNYIGQYTNHVLKNKAYKTVYYVINANDVSIEVVSSHDRIGDMQCAIDELIRNSADCINNMYNIVIVDKVLKPIRTTLKRNKQSKEQYQQYFREYYKNNKSKFIRPAQHKAYYEAKKLAKLGLETKTNENIILPEILEIV